MRPHADYRDGGKHRPSFNPLRFRQSLQCTPTSNPVGEATLIPTINRRGTISIQSNISSHSDEKTDHQTLTFMIMDNPQLGHGQVR